MSANDVDHPGSLPRLLGAGSALILFATLIHFLASGAAAPAPLGWVFRSVTVRHRLGEGWGVSHWDGSGRRVGPPAANDAKPVLILGDSFVESLQVNDGETFAARVQGLVPGIRTVNAGRSGGAPPDYLLEAAGLRQELQPAWTVIELQPDDLEGDSFQPGKAHFVESGGALTSVAVPPRYGRISELLRRVRSHASLLDYGIHRWDAYRSTSKLPPLFLAAGRAEHAAPNAGAVARSWPVERELETLRMAFGGRVTFLLLPPFEPVPGSTERRFRDYCMSRGASCVDFRADFAAFRARGDAPYGFPNSRFGFGHLNRGGHLAVAHLLGSELSEVRRRGLF